jgi:hypothetical protein
VRSSFVGPGKEYLEVEELGGVYGLVGSVSPRLNLAPRTLGRMRGLEIFASVVDVAGGVESPADRFGSLRGLGFFFTRGGFEEGMVSFDMGAELDVDSIPEPLLVWPPFDGSMGGLG